MQPPESPALQPDGLGAPAPPQRNYVTGALAPLRHQAFWVGAVLVAICLLMTWLKPDAFATAANLFNNTRNLAFIGILALGMTAVILTGGIDLSVGSIVGVSGMVTALVMNAGPPWWAGWWLAALTGMGVGAICGSINGTLIAYFRLSSFVVTLGMLSIARSLAIILSGNKLIADLGPNPDVFLWLGGGNLLGFAPPFWILLILALLFGLVLVHTAWGRWLYAIGGNEPAARLTGVPVDRIKFQAYLLSGLLAGLVGVLSVSWAGSASNNLGFGYELRVVASAVIGGANLMGGEGGALGAVLGAALLEVIRNSLVLAGVDANWQGVFVGSILILAIGLQRLRASARD